MVVELKRVLLAVHARFEGLGLDLFGPYEEADGGEQPRDDGRRQQLDERAQLHSTGEVEEAAGKEGGPRDGVEDMHLSLEHQGLSWERRVKR